MRIAKFLANAGVASRRKCEELICQRRVMVNGLVIDTPAFLVNPAKDIVTCDGQTIHLPTSYVTYALNKPVGYTCTVSDPHAEHTIYELLPDELHSLHYIGRLDRDTEGLLLMTNDGALEQAITHPSYEIEKRYIALCKGAFDRTIERQMLAGIEDDSEYLRAKRVRSRAAQKPGCILIEMVLTEGHKREVRRLCTAFGLRVLALRRTSVGNIQLGDLPLGEYRPLSDAELANLKQLIYGEKHV
ncbi:MAG: rRNA pseudouridine synthase [Victivallales bacterium]|nr:rRNA pseudouridine synthase [Victivallales bacterium]